MCFTQQATKHGILISKQVAKPTASRGSQARQVRGSVGWTPAMRLKEEATMQSLQTGARGTQARVARLPTFQERPDIGVSRACV